MSAIYSRCTYVFLAKDAITILALHKKNQLYALFVLSLFRQSTSTCFGHICNPSSGGILYIYIYTVHARNTYRLTDEIN